MTARVARPVVLVGDVAQVRAALERAQLDGRLVEVREAAKLGPDRVRVTAELLEPPGSRRWLRVKPWAIAAGVAVLVAAVVLVVLAVAALVQMIAAWVAAHLPVIVAVAVGTLLLGCVGGGAGCPGLHCLGCRR